MNDVLEKLRKGGYDTPRLNAFEAAPAVVQAIIQQQVARRANPAIQALDQYRRQYMAAQDDPARQAANKMASQVRANFLVAGGSPQEIPQQYWGADIGQGFQTTEGFQAPTTGYEGLPYQQRDAAMERRRQAMADALKTKQLELSPEMQDWYLPLSKQLLEAQIATQQRSANAPYSTGGSPTLTERTRQSVGSAAQSVADALNTLKNAYGTQQYADMYSTEYGVLAPAQVVEQQINAQRAKLLAQGINPDDLIDEAYKMAYGMGRKDYWGQF